MFTDMEKWAEIRRRVLNDEISKRAACAEYEIHWETLQKILTHSEPPGYRRTKPRQSKLEPFLPIIHEILKSDRVRSITPRNMVGRPVVLCSAVTRVTKGTSTNHCLLSRARTHMSEDVTCSTTRTAAGATADSSIVGLRRCNCGR